MQQQKPCGRRCDKTRYRGRREGIDAFEVHGRIGELSFVDEVEGGVQEVGGQLEGLRGEAREGVAAGFGGAEGEGEEGLIAGGEDGEVVGHFLVMGGEELGGVGRIRWSGGHWGVRC